MLDRVTAAEYVRPTTSGRTCPLIVNCERPDGSYVTAVAKFSEFCELKAAHLVRETIAACLAGDLGLPIPAPLLIEIPDGWAELVTDPNARTKINASSRVAFGSTMFTGGYSVWTPDTHLTEGMVDVAAGIFAFDAIIQNPDRRTENPNCLVRGEQIRIIDHELAFAHRLFLGWRPPWLPGGLNWLETKGSHIFRSGLKRATVDLAVIEQRWASILDQRLEEYRAILPIEWVHVSPDADAALELVRNARDNIGDCMREIRRVLS